MLRSTARLAQSFLKPISVTPLPISRPLTAGIFFRRQFSYVKGTALELIVAVQEKNHAEIDRIARVTPRMIVEQTSNDNTALHEAAKAGDIEMIKKLANAFSVNFNVNHKCHCYKRRTPLAYAVEGGHIAAVNLLLSLGADANITDEKNWTALDYAINGIKLGVNKEAFEKVFLTLQEHNGRANNFFPESLTIRKELKNHLETQRFFENYKVSARQKIAESQKQYLDGLKKITSGKP